MHNINVIRVVIHKVNFVLAHKNILSEFFSSRLYFSIKL
jgi:hypothetical protein